MPVKFNFPPDTKWLYPENKAFAEAKLAGKNAEPVHKREIQHNFDTLDFDFLSPLWVYGYAIAGILALTATVITIFWTIFAFNDPDMVDRLNPFAPGNRFRDNWLGIPIIVFLITLPMGIGMLRWALSIHPYLKYPSSGERHYYQLLDKGRIIMARVEALQTLDERMVRIKFSLKSGRATGEYKTISTVAKTLKTGDKVVLFSQGDYDILL